jgi:hypothetical protein
MSESPSAAQRVIAVPELLDHILLCLLQDLIPPTNRDDVRSENTKRNAQLLRTLLRCSEIGTAWHRSIFHGPEQLRKSLFLEAELEDSRSWQQVSDLYPNQQSYYRGLALRAPVLNPVIQTAYADYHFRYWRSGLGAEGPRHHAYLIITRRHIGHARQSISAGLGAGIRNMLLAQPPPTELTATVWERNDQLRDFNARTTGISDPVIRCRDGVRLDLVLAKVGLMFDEHEDVTSIKVTTV